MSNGFIKYDAAPGWSHPSAGSTRPGLVALKDFLLKRYGGTYLGGFVDRAMNGGSNPSLHRDGRAIDWRQDNEHTRVAAAEYLIAHADELQIQRIHDYENNRIWYCGDTGSGQKSRGWHTANGGESFGESWAKWLHIEMNYKGALDIRSIENRIGPTAPVVNLQLIGDVFEAVKTLPIRVGQDRSKAVPLVVLWLGILGYYPKTNGTIYTPEIARTIKGFQKLWKIKLIPDGVVDTKTLTKLAERVRAKSS